jgi:Flp pilus assembly protein TadG
MLRRAVSFVRGALARCTRDRRGIAAVEFAIVVPVILILYVGAADVTRAVQMGRRLDLLSRTLSDLVSQQSTTTPVTASTVGLIFGAATAVMAPFPTSSVTLTVSAVDIKAKSDGTCCQALVRWSFTQNGTLRACTTPLTQVGNGAPASATTIPSSIILANSTGGFNYLAGSTSYLIIADITGTYTPFFTSLPPPLGNPSTWFQAGMRRTTYMVPRSPTGPIKLATPITGTGPGQSGVVCF